MQALEELAMSYDYKDREIEAACRERDQLQMDMETLKVGAGVGYMRRLCSEERVISMSEMPAPSLSSPSLSCP